MALHFSNCLASGGSVLHVPEVLVTTSLIELEVDQCQSPLARWLDLPIFCKSVDDDGYESTGDDTTASSHTFGQINSAGSSDLCRATESDVGNDVTIRQQGKTSTLRRRRQRQRAAAALKQSHESVCVAQNPGTDSRNPIKPKLEKTEIPKLDAKNNFSHMMKRLEDGEQRDIDAIAASLVRSVRRATFDREGCRVMQKLMDVGDRPNILALSSELHGCVRAAMQSPYGNYVLQKLIVTLPPSDVGFIAEEALGVAADMCRHRFACRIISRLLEHSANYFSTVALVDAVLEQAGDLCRHSYGHYVMEAVLEHGLPAQQQLVAAALESDLPANLRCQRGIHVVEKALSQCDPAQSRCFATSLARSPVSLVDLACDRFGSRVVLAILRLGGESATIACSLLQPILAQPSRSKCVAEIKREIQEMRESLQIANGQCTRTI